MTIRTNTISFIALEVVMQAAATEAHGKKAITKIAEAEVKSRAEIGDIFDDSPGIGDLFNVNSSDHNPEAQEGHIEDAVERVMDAVADILDDPAKEAKILRMQIKALEQFIEFLDHAAKVRA